MPERPWIREFEIDGAKTTDTTYRTAIIEHYTTILGRSFIDLGAADAYEARAMAHRGARLALAVEGKDRQFVLAKAAQDYLRLPNHDVKKLDVRHWRPARPQRTVSRRR